MANYFSIFLVLLTVASGLIWLIDSLVFAPKRKERLASAGVDTTVDANGNAIELPYIVDTAQQIFPVIAFVLILRSFLYEPFQIPSGSMMPTLLVGDFILVEKFSYGLKDPVARKKFFETGSPERGDVVVFKYPLDPRVDYIKRVVGLPGDTVIYRNKQIFVRPACESKQDCQPMKPVALNSTGDYPHEGQMLRMFSEQLGEIKHNVLRNPRRPVDSRQYRPVQPGTQRDEWIVPEGKYFAMGDNRDNSLDSRFWGFVPEENLVGKAVAIWTSFEFENDPDGFFSWVPTGIRFDRIGGIQ